MVFGYIKVVILFVKLFKIKNKFSFKMVFVLRIGISDYLIGFVDFFVKIEVINFCYEFLLVEVEICLQVGLDEGKVLN